LEGLYLGGAHLCLPLRLLLQWRWKTATAGWNKRLTCRFSDEKPSVYNVPPQHRLKLLTTKRRWSGDAYLRQPQAIYKISVRDWIAKGPTRYWIVFQLSVTPQDSCQTPRSSTLQFWKIYGHQWLKLIQDPLPPKWWPSFVANCLSSSQTIAEICGKGNLPVLLPNDSWDLWKIAFSSHGGWSLKGLQIVTFHFNCHLSFKSVVLIFRFEIEINGTVSSWNKPSWIGLNKLFAALCKCRGLYVSWIPGSGWYLGSTTSNYMWGDLLSFSSSLQRSQLE